MLILFCVVGNVLGGILGFFGGAYFTEVKASIERQTIEWQLYDSPVRFAEIIDVTEDKVWAQTAQRDIYFRDSHCDPRQNCKPWTKVKYGEGDFHYPLTDGYYTCSLSREADLLKSEKPPGKMIACHRYNYNFFVLLEDGTIWHRELPYPGDDIPIEAKIFMNIGRLCGAIAGGAVVFVPWIGTRKLPRIGRKKAQPEQE